MNNRATLRDRLVNYLKKQTGYVAKGELETLVVTKTIYTADNCGRRLRELAEEGILLVKQIRGHAHYKYNEETFSPEKALASFEAYV